MASSVYYSIFKMTAIENHSVLIEKGCGSYIVLNSYKISRLCWTDPMRHVIECVDFGGQNRHTLVEIEESSFQGLSVYQVSFISYLMITC